MPSGELPLVDDCAHCLGLCCVLLGFSRSADFASDKPAGEPCPQLDGTYRCTIHDRLDARGYRGCVTFSCFGAGPSLTRAAAGRTWIEDPQMHARLTAAFPQARRLHELAWHLREADTHPLPPELEAKVQAARRRVEGMATASLDEIASADVAAIWPGAVVVLAEVSEHLRGPRPGRNLKEADLAGARLRGADLRRANLRGACLIGADLREADLRLADVTGADLRDARLAGADLSTALFLTSGQLVPARGSRKTRLPATMTAPATWGATSAG